MARTVQGPKPGEIRKYIPDVEIDGWKNRDDEEPVTFHIKNPTEADRREIYARFAAKRVEIADGKAVALDLSAEEHNLWKRYAIEMFVEKVENYTGADGQAIDSGERFFAHGESAFVEDVAAEVVTGFSLREEEKKT